MPIRLLIADDHGILRAGLAALLNAEPDMEVIGEASDESSVVQLTLEKKPDLVLMDISMPESGGFEATRRIRQTAPQVRVLILTAHEDKSMIQEAINAGAMGYILKRAIKDELINAIHAVMRDQVYIHPSMTRLLLTEAPPAQSSKADDLIQLLTPRETDVLRLIAQGYTNQQTAQMLFISTRTVEYHRAKMTSKLNMSSRIDLMRFAEENGLI